MQTWLPTFLLIGIGLVPLRGQIVPDTAFARLLTAMQLEIIQPLESDYRLVRTTENDLLACPLAIRSRREKLEIRFAVRPAAEMGYLADAPHVAAGTLAANLASNDEDAFLAVHSLAAEAVRELYGADWLKIYTFPPKRSFSESENCQMIALYREGIGMAYIFLLFNRAPDLLDARANALRFTSLPPAPERR
jgi:hypothetical protein